VRCRRGSTLLTRIAAATGQQETDDGNTEISHHVIYLPGILPEETPSC